MENTQGCWIYSAIRGIRLREMKDLSNFIFLINPPNLTDTCVEMIMSNVKDLVT